MIVDIIIIAIVLISILVGKKRGLTACLINILSVVVALIIAALAFRQVGNYIYYDTPIGENIKNTIKSNIPMNDENIEVEINTNLPKGIQDYISGQTDAVNETKDSTIESVSTELAKDIIKIIAFVLIFMLVRLVLLIVKAISKIITKLPILKQIDQLGGAICGVIEGIILVYAILAVLSAISPAIKNTEILNQVNNSFIGKAMYNNNLIVNKIYNK